MRLQKLAPVLAAVATLGLLAGCGIDVADKPASAPKLPPTSAAPAEAPAPSPEPSIETKQPGEPFTITELSGHVLATVVVDSIEPDYTCDTEFAETPENGHFVALKVRMSIADDAKPSDTVGFMNPFDFSIKDSTGLTNPNVYTSAAAMCVDTNDQFPADVPQAGAKYTGTILLDSPTEHGTVVYPVGVDGDGVQWDF